MMETLIPRKSAELLLQPIDDTHAFAVNCSIPNSLRILNRRQFEILKAINNWDDLNVISTKLALQPLELGKFLSMLTKTEIVRFDDNFSKPHKPDNPNSLNFGFIPQTHATWVVATATYRR